MAQLVYLNRREPGVRAGEGLYWRFENAIKEMESRFGGTLVATGAIYALRRSIWQPLPAGISDDSVTPLLALKAGYRVVVEPNARAFERAANDLSEEFGRKARMVTRQLGAHRHVGYFLKPFRPMLAFRLASHKLMRWLVPFFLLGALVTNLFLLAQPFYQATLALAGLGAIAFLAGKAALKRSVPLPAPLRLWVYFCTVNAAAFTGVIDFLRGRHRAMWAVSPSTEIEHASFLVPRSTFPCEAGARTRERTWNVERGTERGTGNWERGTIPCYCLFAFGAHVGHNREVRCKSGAVPPL